MKGIIFSEPMFNATIKGTKTQTRQVMKNQPDCEMASVMNEYIRDGMFENVFRCVDYKQYKPRYKLGETLYLKEPYFLKWIPKMEDNPFSEGFYKVFYIYRKPIRTDIVDWRKPSTMLAKYARYFIEITGVRCERAQDISDEDCLKEGIKLYDGFSRESGFCTNAVTKRIKGTEYILPFDTPQQPFAALFDKINGKGAWESNPYVWVYDYVITNSTKSI